MRIRATACSRRPPPSVTAASLIGAGLTSARARSSGGYDQRLHGPGLPEPQVCRGIEPGAATTTGATSTRPTNGYKVLLVYTAPPGRATPTSARPWAGLNPPLTAANVVQNGIIELGQTNGFSVDWTEDLAELRHPASCSSTTRSSSSAPRGTRSTTPPRRRCGSVHPRWWRLRRRSQRVRHRVQLGLVRRPARRRPTVRPRRRADRHGATVDRHDASTKGLPATWTVEDEWYNLVPAPQGCGSSPRSTRARSAGAASATTATRARRLPPGGLVPVLRRRPGVADHARARRGRLGDGSDVPGRAVLPAAAARRHRERHGHETVLPG